MHFGKNPWQINLKSGLFSVAVYTPISDPISDVHWLIRRKIGSAVRGCAIILVVSSHGGATSSALAHFKITDSGSSCIHGSV